MKSVTRVSGLIDFVPMLACVQKDLFLLDPIIIVFCEDAILSTAVVMVCWILITKNVILLSKRTLIAAINVFAHTRTCRMAKENAC